MNSILPEKSPLKILPVLFAPLKQGANQTIKSSLEKNPDPRTLLLIKFGNKILLLFLKSTNLEQR